MWMMDLIGYLFGAIIALILFGIILALITMIICVVGNAIEYVQGKEDGFFHNIMQNLH